jgi:riboflavin kinase/FMN adenylyltransferase
LARFLNSLDNLSLPNVWVTIGSFDGVHQGHQSLLTEMVQQAHKDGSPTVALTFYPHPGVVLGGRNGAFYLTHPDERARLLVEIGIDAVITLPFNREMASHTAYQFMNLLKSKLDLVHLWVGENFALGRNREGTIPRLIEIGRMLGYRLTTVAPFMVNGIVVSSSLIRSYLNDGQVILANEALGRPYTIKGEVVQGDQRGRLLGFPTANLSVWPEQLLPARGVYAGWAEVDEGRFRAITNIGLRPTFAGSDTVYRVETHLIDYSGDLYQKCLRLGFSARLREEQRFESVDGLIAQLHQDKLNAQKVLYDE